MTQPTDQITDGDSDLNRFNPERFRITTPIADPLVEVIPVDEVIRKRDRTAGYFSIIPLTAARHFSAADRVLLLLAHAPYIQDPDLDGDWFKLRTGIASDFHLRDKAARHRALAALEKAGAIEVRREPGKSPYIRLSPDHRADFQHAIDASRSRRGGTRMRIREV
jgi:hypothetical protein